MSPDELTGLMTRAEILDQLKNALALASQQNQPLTAVYVDCHHLLRINNEYGHVAGDELIRIVGDVVNESAQGIPSAASGRVGGDEFILILPGLSPEQALEVAETVRGGVESRPLTITRDGQSIDVPVSVSIGVAYFPDEAVSLTDEELVRRAYEALLRAKVAGGNTVCVYSEIEEHDPLTHTLKRAGILARFAEAREQADAARSSASIINLDIDEFDSINQQYGRYTGDEVLRRVGHVLASNFKELGFVGRYAGDEFVILLPEARAETAFVLAEEVRRAIQDTPVEVRVGEQKASLTVHVSGGVAEYPTDGGDWESLFRRSDEAMFRAKRLGRNRICLPVSSQMVTKTSHYTQTQLEKLSDLAKKTGKTEAHLLREGLDDLLRKYEV
jgi:diguanylate cyclase